MSREVLAGTLNQRINVTGGACLDLKKQRPNVTGGAGQRTNQFHRRSWLGPKKQRPNVTGGAGWDHKTEDQPIPPEVLAWT